MPIPYLTSIDMNKNEVLNQVVHKLSSAPSSPVTGQVYYNTSTNKLMICVSIGPDTWAPLIGENVFTTKGDLISATAASTVSRIGVGTNGQVLTANSATGTGLAWADPGAPGAHAATHVTGGTDVIANAVSNGNAGLMTGADKKKLDEAGSTIVNSTIVMRDSAGRARVTSPTHDDDIATKLYVDATTTGLDFKQSVRAATTVAIALTGVQTIDGVSVIAGNRVLVKNQGGGASDATNGIYVAAAGVWSRATDADTDAEVNPGMFCFVEEGTVNANIGWVLSTNNPITLGTTALQFTQFSSQGVILAGTGLTKSGNTISATYSATAPLVAAVSGSAGAENTLARTDHVHPHATQPVDKGGTNLTSYAQGDLLYATGATTLDKLAKSATAGHVLKNSGTTNNPQWGKVAYADLDSIPSSFAPAAHNLIDTTGHPVSGLTTGHTIRATAANTYAFQRLGVTDLGATNWRMLYSDATGIVQELALGTSGQVLKSNGAAVAPTWQADNNTDTATATDDILKGSNTGTAIRYAPYVVGDKAAGRLYAGVTDPTLTTRLNYDGHFHATALYVGGTAVSTTDTTYSAGTGIDLTGTVFSVAGGDGLEAEATGLKMGTPSSITASSTNGVTATSHTHTLTLNAADLAGMGATRKYTVTNPANVTWTITHNFNTRDVNVLIRETNAPYAQVFTDVEMNTTNAVIARFATAPTAAAYTAVVVG